MKDIPQLIKEEWEAAVLAGVVAVLLLAGLLAFLDSGERVLNIPGIGINTASEGLLTDEGMAFLNKREPVEITGSRPFALPEWALIPMPEKPKAVAKPKPAPKIAETPKPAVVEAPAEPAPAPEPPKPVVKAPVPQAGKLYFAEAQAIGDGTIVALMQLSCGDSEQVLSLGEGETELGIKVLAVDKKSVVVQDAKNRRIRLKREAEQNLWFLDE